MERNERYFVWDGICAAVMTAAIQAVGNLYAMYLHADNRQLGLFGSLPSLAGIFVLVPGVFVLRKSKKKKRVTMQSALGIGFFYFLMAGTSWFGAYGIWFFILTAALLNAPASIYNSVWQTFFFEMVPEGERNDVLARRTRATLLVNLVLPLVTGGLLFWGGQEKKGVIYQSLFLFCFILSLLQCFFLKSIEGDGIQEEEQEEPVGRFLLNLKNEKKLLGFLVLITFIYVGWAMDGSVYFYAQITYLKANELWMGIFNVAGYLCQIAGIARWEKAGKRKGSWYILMAGVLGLVLCTAAIYLSIQFPPEIGVFVFLLMNSVANYMLCALPLAGLECLFEMISMKDRTAAIALYNFAILIAKFLMPMTGMGVFTALGGEMRAMNLVMGTILALRLAALWVTGRRYVGEKKLG